MPYGVTTNLWLSALAAEAEDNRRIIFHFTLAGTNK